MSTSDDEGRAVFTYTTTKCYNVDTINDSERVFVMNTTIGERVRNLRRQLGFTQEELSRKMGYASKTTITKIENDQRPVSSKQLDKLADALKTTKAYLVDGDETNGKLSCVQFPVLGDVAAGFDFMANVEDTGDYEFIPREWLHGQDPDNFLVIKVRGDSMYPKYQNGDRVLVRRLPSVPSGSDAVIVFDSDYVSLKRLNYCQGQDWLELIPLNPEYAPRVITGPDLERCRVCGQVWKTIRDNI